MAKETFEAKKTCVPNVIKYIQTQADKYKLDGQTLTKALLEAEEVFNAFCSHAPKGSKATIEVNRHFLINSKIKISMPGDEFDISDEIIDTFSDVDYDGAGVGDSSKEQINSIIFKAFRNNIKYKHSKGKNYCEITASRNPRSFLYFTLIAVFLGIVLGFICKSFVDPDIVGGIVDYFVDPMNTIVFNAIMLILAPVVFFTIVCCITSFGSLSDLGRIGFKVLRIYMLTSIFAICIGLVVGTVFNCGDPEIVSSATEQGLENLSYVKSSSGTLLSTITNIVPDNFLKPFLETNMLSLIFIAILSGISLSLVRNTCQGLIKIFDQLNEFFLKMMSIVIKTVPLFIFGSVYICILTLSLEALSSIVNLLILIVLSCLLMLVVYALLTFAFIRISPFIFLKNVFPLWTAAASTCSSTACMPITMGVCKSFGVKKKIYSFSIPLGVTINMDGDAIINTIIALFMFKVFGIEVDASLIILIIVTTLLVTIATPGIPNAQPVIFLTLFSQLGIPLIALSLLMGINVFIDMLTTATNVVGDVFASLIVSKSEERG